MSSGRRVGRYWWRRTTKNCRTRMRYLKGVNDMRQIQIRRCTSKTVLSQPDLRSPSGRVLPF